MGMLLVPPLVLHRKVLYKIRKSTSGLIVLVLVLILVLVRSVAFLFQVFPCKVDTHTQHKGHPVASHKDLSIASWLSSHHTFFFHGLLRLSVQVQVQV